MYINKNTIIGHGEYAENKPPKMTNKQRKINKQNAEIVQLYSNFKDIQNFDNTNTEYNIIPIEEMRLDLGL